MERRRGPSGRREREEGSHGARDELRVLRFVHDVRGEDYVVPLVAGGDVRPVEWGDGGGCEGRKVELDVVCEVGERVGVKVGQEKVRSLVRALQERRGGEPDEACTAAEFEDTERGK